MESQEHTKQESGFFGKWTLAGLIGFVLGVMAAGQLTRLLSTVYPSYDNSGIGFGFGLGVGLMQYVVLRRFVTIDGRWMLFSSIGLGLPVMIAVMSGFNQHLEFDKLTSDIIGVIILGVIPGLLIGILQAPSLRKETSRGKYWPLVNAVGWTFGWLSAISGLFILGPIVMSAITGLGLIWIFSQQKNSNPLSFRF